MNNKMMDALYAQGARPLIESSEHITDGIREGDWQLFVQQFQTPLGFKYSPECDCTYDQYFDQLCKIIGWQVIGAIGLMPTTNGLEAIIAFKAKRGFPVKTPIIGF